MKIFILVMVMAGAVWATCPTCGGAGVVTEQCICRGRHYCATCNNTGVIIKKCRACERRERTDRNVEMMQQGLTQIGQSNLTDEQILKGCAIATVAVIVIGMLAYGANQ